MKRTFKFLFAGAVALLAFVSCNDDEDEKAIETVYDDAYYAAEATVTSSDSIFTASEDGGAVNFKTEGGAVTFDVSCGCDWLAENSNPDSFDVATTSASLTITAEQNEVEEELTGTVTFKTANQGITFFTVTVSQNAYGAPEISVSVSECAFPAVGDLTSEEITVEASDEWKAETLADWLTIDTTADGFTITASENEDTAEREADVTVSCTDGVSTVSETVKVTQDGKAYITLGKEAVAFGKDAGEASVTVESNFDFECTADEWVTVTKSTDGITVSVSENTSGEDRTGTVTITAGDGAENVAEATLSVSQSVYSESSMVLVYTIATDNTTAYFPAKSDNGVDVNCTVDWGDGTTETITSTAPTHTYATAGEYEVVISGTVPALYSNSISTSASPIPITAVKQWGKTGLTNMTYAFRYCAISSFPEDAGDAFAEVTDFSYAFNNLNATTVPAGLFGNCPKVTTFQAAFNAAKLVSVPAGLFDGCTAATNFQSAFASCTALTSIPSGLFKNTAATNFQAVFSGCSTLPEIPAGLFEGCTQATNFTSAFTTCYAVKEIPKGLLDDCVSATTFTTFFQGPQGGSDVMLLETIPEGLFDSCTEATTFGQAFQICRSLKTIPAGLFDKCTKVTDFNNVFNNCSLALETIPAGLFDNCPDVTTFASAFTNCLLLKEIPKDLFKNNTKVTTFNSTFSYCQALTEVPEHLFDYCPLVTDFASVFSYCTKMLTFPEGLFDNCPEVTTFNSAFRNCTELTTFPTSMFAKNLKVINFGSTFNADANLTSESPYDYVGEEKVHLYERANHTADGYTAPTTTSSCFTNCKYMEDYNSIPSSWGGGGN